MPLDPQAQALLEQMKQRGLGYTPDLTVERARETLKAMQTVRPQGEPVARVEDRMIRGPAGEVPLKINNPDGDRLFPGLVFFLIHGREGGHPHTLEPPLPP